jgi:hypothetical protein
MSTAKNAMYGDTDEATFGFLRIRRTTYPNELTLFQLGPKAADIDDPRGTISINAKPVELLAELRRIAEWLEAHR